MKIGSKDGDCTFVRSGAPAPAISLVAYSGANRLLPCAAAMALAAFGREADVTRPSWSVAPPRGPLVPAVQTRGPAMSVGAWRCLTLESGEASQQTHFFETRQRRRRQEWDCVKNARELRDDCGGKRRLRDATEKGDLGDGSGDNALPASKTSAAPFTFQKDYFRREWLGGECFEAYRSRAVLLDICWGKRAYSTSICSRHFRINIPAAIRGTFRESLTVAAELRVLAEFRFQHDLPAVKRAWNTMGVPILRWWMRPYFSAEEEDALAGAWEASARLNSFDRRRALSWSTLEMQRFITASAALANNKNEKEAADDGCCLSCRLVEILEAKSGFGTKDPVFFVPDLDALVRCGGDKISLLESGNAAGGAQSCCRCSNTLDGDESCLRALGRTMDLRLRRALWRRQRNGVVYYLMMLRLPPPPPLEVVRNCSVALGVAASVAWERLRLTKQRLSGSTICAPHFQLRCIAQWRVCQYFVAAVRTLTSMPVTLRLIDKKRSSAFYFATGTPFELTVVTAVVGHDLKNNWERHISGGAWMVRPELWSSVWQRAVTAAAGGAPHSSSAHCIREFLCWKCIDAQKRARAAGERSNVKCVFEDGGNNVFPQLPRVGKNVALHPDGASGSTALQSLPVKREVFEDVGTTERSETATRGDVKCRVKDEAENSPPYDDSENPSLSPSLLSGGGELQVKKEPESPQSDFGTDLPSCADESSCVTFKDPDIKIEEHRLEWNEELEGRFDEHQTARVELERKKLEKDTHDASVDRGASQVADAKFEPKGKAFSPTLNLALLTSQWLRGALKIAWQVALLAAIDTENSTGIGTHEPCPPPISREKRRKQSSKSLSSSLEREGHSLSPSNTRPPVWSQPPAAPPDGSSVAPAVDGPAVQRRGPAGQLASERRRGKHLAAIPAAL